MRPVSYISKVPKNLQKQGRAANSAKRSKEELIDGVAEWVENKFRKKKKTDLIKKICPAKWSSELVINVVKSSDEVKLIQSHGITIIDLSGIVSSLGEEDFILKSAGGADFVDLIHMGTNNA